MNKINEDNRNLDLLSMFHYVLSGITALFSCMPFMHVFMGLAIVSGQFFEEGKGSGPPLFFGWIFVIMGSLFIVIGWSLAVVMFIAARKLKQRKDRIFCMIVAGFECLFMPLGVVLGVFTLIALSKDSIREIFAPSEPEDKNISAGSL